MSKRVALTGLGIYSSAGKDLSSLKETVLSAKRCFTKIPHIELQGFGDNVAALVEFYPEPELLQNLEENDFDPVVKLAAEAVSQAILDAGLDINNIGPDTALIVSTCSGPMLSIEKFYSEKNDTLPPLSYSSICTTLSKALNLSGFTTTVTTACSAGSAAVGIGADLIREGSAKRAIIVGADTFAPTTFAGFFGLKAVSEKGSTPFSEISGMTLGEAGAAVILEDMELAENRDAKVISEIAGFGLSNDAFHCSAPDNSGKGQSYAMARGLKQSGITVDVISYINAHGTGTAANDKAETKAVRRVFSEKADFISMSSTKSMIGHCLGAAGIVEMIASFCAASENILPPTAGFTASREGCDIDPVAETDKEWSDNGPFMNNNFAFGGNNASLLLSKDGKFDNCSVEEINNKKIVITGIGVISSAGIGCEALKNGVQNDDFSVENFDERKIDRRLDLKGMDRSSRFASVASKLAITEADFKERPSALRELGLILGLSTGTTSAEEEHIKPLMNNGFTIDKVQSFPYVVPNSIQGNVCRALLLQGHNTVITAGKDSSHEALRLAVSAIKSGHTDSILCGAVNEKQASDPIHKDPQGEGAAVFMIENEESALKRKAKPIAEIVGESFFFSQKEDLEGLFNEKIGELINKSNINMDNILAIALTDPFKKIKFVSNYNDIKVVDLKNFIGDTESCSSLMNIAYILSSEPFDIKDDKNYILSLSSDENGANSIILLKTI